MYVDNIITTGNDKEEVNHLKEYLGKEFETKHLDDLKYFSGEVARSKKGITNYSSNIYLGLNKRNWYAGCKTSGNYYKAESMS